MNDDESPTDEYALLCAEELTEEDCRQLEMLYEMAFVGWATLTVVVAVLACLNPAA